MYRRLSALRGLSAIIALVGGIIFLITGFVPKKNGYMVQQPMSTVLLSSPPEQVEPWPGGCTEGPEAWLESIWRVYSAYKAEPALPRTLPVEGARLNNDAPQSLLAFVPDGFGLAFSTISAEDSLEPDAGYALPLSDLRAVSRGYSSAGETMPVGALIDSSRRICIVPPLRVQRDEPVSPQSVKAAASSVVPASGQGFASLTRRTGEYRELVEQYAKKYGLSSDLVFAIMHTESSFNPQAVSRANALGLMQVVPGLAGGEVHAYLNGTPGLPAETSLFNPAFNINYGTTYLYLLGTRHLGEIKDPASRMFCIIAAYNGGPTAVYKAFGGERQEAIDAINALTPAEVLERLLARLPRKETREYVGKVLTSLEKFSALR